MRTTVAALVGAVLLTGGLAACSSETPSSTPQAPEIKPVAETAVAEPAASGDQPKGLTYDVKRIPLGAKLSTGSSVENGQTTVELKVSGLLPNTKYGSHVHTKPCGAKPADSGPHYQNEKDPVTPSVLVQQATSHGSERLISFLSSGRRAAETVVRSVRLARLDMTEVSVKVALW